MNGEDGTGLRTYDFSGAMVTWLEGDSSFNISIYIYNYIYIYIISGLRTLGGNKDSGKLT